MSVGGGGIKTSRKMVPADEGAGIAKALSLIVGLVESPKDVKANLVKLQTATKAAKEESDRLIKARTADGFMKEAARVRATARQNLSDSEERAEIVIKDATTRVMEGLKKLEKERAEFERSRYKYTEDTAQALKDLNDREKVIQHNEDSLRELTAEAKRATKLATQAKASYASKIRAIKEFLKE